MEVVLSPQFSLGHFILVGEIGLPAGAEIDVPAPEPSERRLGILIVVRLELAGLAGVVLGFHGLVQSGFSSKDKYT